MYPIKWFIFLPIFLIFVSCKKVATNNSSTQMKLVSSIYNKYSSADSTGRFRIWVDSFFYDNLQRVVNVKKMVYDTLYAGTNSQTPVIYTAYYSFIYNSNSLFPASLNHEHYLTYDSTGQLIRDSISNNIIWIYSYNNNLITVYSKLSLTNYTIDSLTIDANKNITSDILGGNFYLNNNYNFIFGRIFQWKYNYSNIANPAYSNPSLAVALNIIDNQFQSKNIPSNLTFICYTNNGNITSTRAFNYQLTLNRNGNISTSMDLVNGDIKRWTYY